MRQWCVPAATPRTEPLPGRLSVSPPPADARMECCEVEPRYTIEQIDLLQRLRLSGMTKPQIIHALESLERLDPDHRPTHCDSQPAPSNNAPTTAAPAPSSSSSSSSSSLSLASATTQTSGLDGAALSPSNSYEASPPPLYPPSVAVQRSFSYDMMGEEEWDLEEKVEEYMRRDSNLVKEEIKTFLNNRRISQAIVGQVTGISQSYISQWLLQQGLEMSDSKRRAFYRWYLLERNNPGLRWSESQHSVSPMPRARGGDRDGTVAGASGSLPNPNTNLNPNPVWSRQRELLMHLLPWYTAAAAAAQTQPGATLSMRSLVKEEPDWRTGIMAGDRAGMVGGPLRLRRGSRFTWRKECQSIMESFFMENQYPDEAKREEIANACNSVIQKPGCKLSEFERVTALKVYNWFANRRKEMKRRANIEAAILESHGIEVPSPSCHSNGEEGEMQEFADQVNHRFTEQEETSSLRIVEQQDPSSLATTEVAALPSPTPQFKHVYVYHDLDEPGAKRVQDVDALRGNKGAQLASDTMGSGETSLGDALWCCANLYSDIKLRLSHKRLMIFTCRDEPHMGDSAKDRQARTKASDLKETGVIIDLMHLMKPGGFDVSPFFRDIVSPPEDESELGLQLEPCDKLEDLQKRVRSKEQKKRAMARLNLCLGEGMNIAVGMYATAVTARKPGPIKLYRETNEPVRSKTRTFHTQTGSLLLPSEIKKAQTYGKKQIVMERDEVDAIKKFEDPGLVLIGFKPMERLKLHHHIRPAVFIYPEEGEVKGSACLFAALLTKCSERNVFALCRCIARRNYPPRFVALVPQREEVGDGKVQITPPGFNAIFLPYADDLRTLDPPQCPSASQTQVDKMKEIVSKLRFKYRSEAFENPVIQQHYRNLEALALDMMAPEDTEDLIMPKVDQINHRLGPLVDEFKDLVYPANYNPESKPAAKRKTADAGGGAEKKPKVELSEDELRAHVQKGTLTKLTVPVLKDACKQFGVRTTGTKKQELIDALIAKLGP